MSSHQEGGRLTWRVIGNADEKWIEISNIQSLALPQTSNSAIAEGKFVGRFAFAHLEICEFVSGGASANTNIPVNHVV